MLRALYLVFAAKRTWDKIVVEERSPWSIFVFYFAPLLALSLAPEWFYLTRWGGVNAFTGAMVPLPESVAFKYAAARFGGGVLALFIAAWLIHICGNAFRCRSTYKRCFSLVAYALGPLCLLRAIDCVPGFNPWMALAGEVSLTLIVIYSGIPRMLEPPPAQAIGLFFAVAFVVVSVVSMVRFGTLVVTH